MSVTRRAVLAAGGALVAGSLASALAGCGIGATPPRLTMACGERGGTYVQFGDLLAAALADRGAADLRVRESQGSVDNLALLGSGDADLAIALADAVAEAQAADTELVAIGRVYQNYLQCVVRADGTVRTLDALAGARASIGAPGSGAALTAQRVLEAVDLWDGPRAVERSALQLTEAVDALRDGAIDAFFWSGGVPIPEVERLRSTTRVTLVDCTPALPALDAAHPGLYASTAVPAGVVDAARPIPAIGVSNLLVARPDLAAAIAATLVDALVDDAERLVPDDSVGVQYLTASNLIDTAPASLHPAARARYRERYG
ncbi:MULTISPECIES: TAXI family TRAP transporter solute-binding subunit [unclassified Agrococcus]|uniref:TAXI family TRAP transporter solute-binding subunit n=1 Tax=unclassified Agrococcus TaxID=2615065 RepID=UPI00361188DA